jgi:hypothetical protein
MYIKRADGVRGRRSVGIDHKPTGPMLTRLDIRNDLDPHPMKLPDHRFEIGVPLLVHPKDITIPIFLSNSIAGRQMHPATRDIVLETLLRPVFQ